MDTETDVTTVSSIAEALRLSGVSDHTLTRDHRDRLDEDGFIVLPMSSARWREVGIDIAEQRDLIQKWLDHEGSYGGREGKEDTLTADNPLEPGANRLAAAPQRMTEILSCGHDKATRRSRMALLTATIASAAENTCSSADR